MTTERNVVTHTGTSPVLIWETDTDRRCNYFNEAFRTYAGMEMADLLGDKWLAVVHPDDVDQLIEISSRAFEATLPFTLEARFRRHDGVYRWFLNVGSPRHLPDGTFIGYAGSNFDITESKQVQKTREEEQARLRTILRQAPAMIALVDLDYRFVYVNDCYAEYRDSSPEAMIGKSIAEFLNEKSYERVTSIFDRVLKGETVNYEYVSENDPRVLLVKCSPDLDSNGNVRSFIVFANDVTELRDRKRHFELILNNLPARISYLGLDAKIQWANNTFCKGVDSTLNGLIGCKLADLIGANSFETSEPYFRRAIQGETVFHENIRDRKDGVENLLVYFVPDIGSNGKTRGVFSMTLDISSLKQAEAKLRRSDRRFALALQGPQVGFWETHPDLSADQQDWMLTENIEKLLGLPHGKLKNSFSALSRRIHPDDVELTWNHVKQYRSNSGTHVAEFRLLTADDQYRWFRCVAESELHDQCNLVRAAGTIANIDKLKTAELCAAKQVRNRDVFLSVLSHELRNPLSAIRFAVDYCYENDNGSDAEHRSMLEIIGRQVDQMSRLLVDLLDVTRVASNRLSFDKSSIDLTQLLHQVADSVRHKFQQKQQDLGVCIQEDMPVYGDPVRLSQAFTNLLDNASKYTNQGGTIRLTARKISSRDPDLIAKPPTLSETPAKTIDEVLVVIEDDGCGISSDDQPHIFELFFQEDRSIDRSSGGLGLGLFLVREITEAHGGTIVVASDGAGSGSRFEVRLPSEFPIPADEPSPTNLQEVDTFRLAIVEDGNDSSIALSRALTARNIDVSTWSDGQTASERLPAFMPDVAVIDIGLPNKNGFELIRELRQHEAMNNTVFIALTGYGQESDKREMSMSGFDASLVKPVDVNKLLAVITKTRSQQNTADRRGVTN